MLHAGVVLVAVATRGVGLAFAAVALARGAEALGGVGEREGDEQGKRGQRGEEGAAEREGDGPEELRKRKRPRAPCARGGGPALLMAGGRSFGERKLCFVTFP